MIDEPKTGIRRPDHDEKTAGVSPGGKISGNCRRSALARLETWLGLVDDIYSALAAHDPAVAVARFQRAK